MKLLVLLLAATEDVGAFMGVIRTKVHSSRISMSSNPTPSEPDVRYDANAGWKREENIKEGKGKSTMSQDFGSTDTPDFFDDSEESQKAAKISYTDGMMGSSGMGQNHGTHNPGVEGALEVNPDIYVPEEEVIAVENSDFVLPSSGRTDADFEMFTIQGNAKDLAIEVKPVAMTFEPFYCGFTADSHPAFSVSPDSGKMERRNGDPTSITVTCNPGENVKGELKATLCFILPEEKAFSTYYGITCQAR